MDVQDLAPDELSLLDRVLRVAQESDEFGPQEQTTIGLYRDDIHAEQARQRGDSELSRAQDEEDALADREHDMAGEW